MVSRGSRIRAFRPRSSSDHGCSPAFQDSVDVDSHSVSCLRPAHTGHEQLVIGRVRVAYRGDHRQRDRLGVEGPRCRDPSDSAASARRRVLGDLLRSLPGATWKKPRDLPRQLSLEAPVLRCAPFLVAQPTARPGFLVLEAVGLRLLARRLLDQDPASLLPAP
jgi:hypothetical protein